MDKEEMKLLCADCENSAAELALPDEETTYAISDLFKVFGDTTRLKILFALERGAMCGSHLAEHLGLTKAAISYQLKMLRQHDLVRSKKEGKNVIYQLSDDHVRAIIDCAIEHVNE
jgi:ArsR family transcriptional regulator